MPKPVVCPVWPSFDANPKVERGLNRPCPVGQSVLSHAVSSEESHQSTAEARSTPSLSQSVAPDQLTAFCILEASNGLRRCFGTRSVYTWVEGSVPGDQRSRRLAVEGGLLQRQGAATSLPSCHLAACSPTARRTTSSSESRHTGRRVHTSEGM